jgi:O-antigen/teichoic acid export membrane protein
VEVIFRLAIVFVLRLIVWDKLQIYGILLCAVTFINTTIYRTICKAKYPECKFQLYWNTSLFKEITSYTGWNLFGQLSGMLRNQGTTVLLNQYFNPVIIAAQSIAASINSALSSLSNNFLNALNPQIIKKYSGGQREEMLRLAFRGAKASYFLMFLFTLPFMLEMPLVLSLWLKQPPEYTVLFTRLIMVNVLVNSISYPVVTMAMATGKIKIYDLVLGSIQIISFITAWIILSMGAAVYSVFILSICVDIMMFFARLLLTKRLVAFSIREFMKKTVFPVCVVSVLSSVLPVLMVMFFNQSLLRLAATVLTSVLSLCMFGYFFGLDDDERHYITGYFHR